MKSSTFCFKGSRELEIFTYRWSPDSGVPIKGVVQIIHGMCEHAGRYLGFAAELTHQGYIVYANDHRGHGKTACGQEDMGHLDANCGWNDMVQDIYSLSSIIRKECGKLPLYLFGHSMGSFIARQYINEYGIEIDGAVITGTGLRKPVELRIGIFLAKKEISIFGSHKRSRILNRLVVGAYNRKIHPPRTAFDWLSRDEEQVDLYNNDSACEKVCTASFYHELLRGILKLQSLEKKGYISGRPPLLFMGGDMDPVGGYGKDIPKLVSIYKKKGAEDIEARIYKNARHELLNEINRADVYRDIISWLDSRINSKRGSM